MGGSGSRTGSMNQDTKQVGCSTVIHHESLDGIDKTLSLLNLIDYHAYGNLIITFVALFLKFSFC